MNASDICISKPAPNRRVGIHFHTHTHVIDAAIGLYRDFHIDCTIENDTIYIQCPRIAADYFMGLMERYTGTPGFNDWNDR